MRVETGAIVSQRTNEEQMTALQQKVLEFESRLTAYKIALQVIADAVGPRSQAALLETAREVSNLSMRIVEDERQLDIVRETLGQIARPAVDPPS